MGQVGGLLGEHGAAARGRRRAHLVVSPPCSRFDARPGRRRGASGAAGGDDQPRRTSTTGRPSRMPCEPGGGRPPRLPERLANPGFGRRVLSALAGPDGGGLGLLVIGGPTRSPTGAIFPPTTTAGRRRPARAAPGFAGAGHHRDRQRASDRRRRPPAREQTRVLRGPLGQSRCTST